MKLFVFTSTTLTNIWAGIGAGLWAVPAPSPTTEKSIRTKAGQMELGSCGVLYCSESQALTVPFLVYSQPDPERVVTDVWPGRWSLPFSIHPLGTPERQMSKEDVLSSLEVGRTSGSNNISHVLPISAPTVFSPKEISTADWAILIDCLAQGR